MSGLHWVIRCQNDRSIAHSLGHRVVTIEWWRVRKAYKERELWGGLLWVAAEKRWTKPDSSRDERLGGVGDRWAGLVARLKYCAKPL